MLFREHLPKKNAKLNIVKYVAINYFKLHRYAGYIVVDPKTIAQTATNLAKFSENSNINYLGERDYFIRDTMIVKCT